ASGVLTGNGMLLVISCDGMDIVWRRWTAVPPTCRSSRALPWMPRSATACCANVSFLKKAFPSSVLAVAVRAVLDLGPTIRGCRCAEEECAMAARWLAYLAGNGLLANVSFWCRQTGRLRALQFSAWDCFRKLSRFSIARINSHPWRAQT